jgi:hypothetical protein
MQPIIGLSPVGTSRPLLVKKKRFVEKEVARKKGVKERK